MIDWEGGEEKKLLLTEMAASESPKGTEMALIDTYREAYDVAIGYLNEGMRHLLLEEHQVFADTAVDVIVARIGADRLVVSGHRGSV